MRWTLVPTPDGQLSKDVEDGRLVYCIETGETRLLSTLSSFAMDLLHNGGPLQTVEVTAAVQAEIPAATPAECAEAVGQALRTLADAGLITASSLLDS